MQIKSVVVKEGDRGYIYIEACENIRSLNLSNLQMVLIKRMTDMLRVSIWNKKKDRGYVLNVEFIQMI